MIARILKFWFVKINRTFCVTGMCSEEEGLVAVSRRNIYTDKCICFNSVLQPFQFILPHFKIKQCYVGNADDPQRETSMLFTINFALKHAVREGLEPIRCEPPCHEKTCFCHLQTTKVQFSLHIHTVLSVLLFFTA